MEKRLKLDYLDSISEFERILKKFNLKKRIYRLLFNARSLEFEQFRDFDETEDASSIDWPASLKSNKLLARQYTEEKEINFYFVVDASSNMLFGSEKRLKAEYASDMTLSLANLIMSSQDRAGLIMFNDKIIHYVPPTNLKNQFFLMEELLSDVSSYGGGANFEEVFKFLLNIIKNPNNLVIFISDFLNLSLDMDKNLSLLTKKCEVISFAVRDPLDLELPTTGNSLVIRDPQSGQTMALDTALAKKAYKEIVEKRTNLVRTTFMNNDIDFLELKITDSFVIPIIQFLQQRSKGGEHGVLA
jgi:uncharacterized protein (DUF58 family)